MYINVLPDANNLHVITVVCLA